MEKFTGKLTVNTGSPRVHEIKSGTLQSYLGYNVYTLASESLRSLEENLCT